MIWVGCRPRTVHFIKRKNCLRAIPDSLTCIVCYLFKLLYHVSFTRSDEHFIIDIDIEKKIIIIDIDCFWDPLFIKQPLLRKGQIPMILHLLQPGLLLKIKPILFLTAYKYKFSKYFATISCLLQFERKEYYKILIARSVFILCIVN